MDGERVALAIRPELLSLDGDATHDNRLEGTLENISFLGAIVRLNCAWMTSVLTLDEFNNPHLALPAIGSTVSITFPSTACLVLNRDNSTPTSESAI